jgi:hypothetical protein
MFEFLSLRARAKWAVALLGVILLIDVAEGVGSVMQIDVLGRIARGAVLAPGEADANDARMQLIAGARLLVFVLAGVAFIRWFRRAYANLQSFGVPLKNPESDALWSFFIPLLNFIRPYDIMRQIWRKSVDAPQSRQPLPGLWWAAYMARTLGATATQLMVRGAGSDAQALSDATALGLGVVAIDVVAAGLAIVLIRTISEAQEKRSQLDVASEFD